ncbi:MAG: hypothetical protein HY056_11615 [Proteobacteria bacterium]|nr:hypothetical protein [Pseudomonadota bacterium]
MPPESAIDQQRKHDVAEHRLPRQQLVEFLKNHHAVRSGPRYRDSGEPDLALDRHHEPGDGLEQRRLSAARRAENDVALAAMDLETHAPGGGDKMFRGLVLQRDVPRLQKRAITRLVGANGCVFCHCSSCVRAPVPPRPCPAWQ